MPAHSHFDDAELVMRRAVSLFDQLRPRLAGYDAEVQGAALVQLVALHLAGHPRQMRETALELHIDAVRSLVPIVEQELFGPAGHPGNIDAQ